MEGQAGQEGEAEGEKEQPYDDCCFLSDSSGENSCLSVLRFRLVEFRFLSWCCPQMP